MDSEKIAKWASGHPPIFEPGLEEVVGSCLNRNLFFSADVAGSIEKADVVFISVNTPTKLFGVGEVSVNC